MNTSKRAQASQKITLIGAVVDFFLAIFKIIIGLLGNSNALIADGIHSFSDLLSDGMVLYAAKHAHDEPDAEHPYGHGRFETVATLGLGIILAIVGVSIIFAAVPRFSSAEPLIYDALLLSVAGVSILFKEALYWFTLKVAKRYQSAMLKANAWHHRSDALSSVVVFIGIICSINGYLYWDGIAAAIVGVMILVIAWQLGLSAVKELVDTSIDPQQIQRLRNALGQISGVNSVHSLRTRKNGGKICCDVHVQVDPFLSVSEGHIISVSVERVAKQCVDGLTDTTVHIDPEDDEIPNLYEHLPERAEALELLNKALLNHRCGGKIERIQLHYLDGKIHVDFYLPLNCLDENINAEEIRNKLKTAVNELSNFGKINTYFG